MNNLSDPEFYKTLDLQLQKKAQNHQIQIYVIYAVLLAIIGFVIHKG